MSDGQVVIDVNLETGKVRADVSLLEKILLALGDKTGDKMDVNFAKNAKSVEDQAKQTSDKVKSDFSKPIDQEITVNGDKAVEQAKKTHSQVKDATYTPAEQKIKAKDEATSEIKKVVDNMRRFPSFKSLAISAKDNASKTIKGVGQTADVTKKSFLSLRDVIAGTLIGAAVSKGFSTLETGMKNFIGLGVEYNKEQQVMNAAWTTLTGSATKAKPLVDMINHLAVSTGQSADLVNELTQGFYHLHSSKSEADNMTKSLLNMGDAVGLTSDQIKTVGLDMVHALSSGKLDLGSLNQISDYFPMFQEQMAKHYNVTVGTMRKMVTAGKVSAAAVEQVFEQLGEVKYGKAADNMMATMTGMERIIKARVPALAGDFEGPFQKAQSGIFSGISKYVSSKQADDEFKKMGQAASSGMTTIINAFSKVFGHGSVGNSMKAFTTDITNGIKNVSGYIASHAKEIAQFFGNVKNDGVAAFKLFGNVLKIVGTLLKPLVELIAKDPKDFAAFALGIYTVIKAMQLWRVVAAALDIELDANPIGAIIAAIGLLVIAISEIVIHWDVVKKGLGAVWGWMKSAWSNTTKQMTDRNSWLNQHTNGAFSDMWSGAKKTFGSGYKALGDGVNVFKDLFTGKWGNLGKDFKKYSSDAWSTVKSYFKTGYNVLNDLTGGMLGKIWSKVKSIGGSIVNFFKSLPSNMANGIKNGAHWVEQAFINLGNGMLSGIGKAVNGVIGGIDWVLSKVDAPTIKPWKVPKFATGGKATGLSIVGEAGKPELIKHSNGDIEMSPNTATLYNFTDPVDILGGDLTEQLLNSGMPMYAGGTWLGGAIDFIKGGWNAIASGAEGFWNAITHPAQLLNTAIAKFVNLSGISPNIAKMASGTVKTVASDTMGWIKKELSNFGGSNPSGSGYQRWAPVIKQAAGMSGVKLSGSMMSDILHRINKESGGDPTVVQKVIDINSRQGHPAQGLLQYIPSTFASWARKGFDKITNGMHQLLAMFNDSNWHADINMPGGWGPTGRKRYATGTTTSVSNFFPKYAKGTSAAASAISTVRFNHSMGRTSTATYIRELEAIEKEYKLTAAQHRSILLSIHTAEKQTASSRSAAGKKASSLAKQRQADAKKADAARQKSYANQIANLQTEYKTGHINRTQYIADLESIEKHHKLNSSLIRQIKTDVYEAQKQFTTAQNTLNKDIASAATTYATKVKSINTDLTNKIKSINTDLQNNIKTLQDQYNSDLSSKQGDIYGGLFNSSSGTVTYKQDLAHQMQESLHDLQSYQNDMSSLSGRLPSGLMDELKAAGVGSESQIHALTTMNNAELSAYVDMWNQRHQIANSEATSELASEKANTDKQIAAAKKSASDQIKAAKSAALKELDAAKTAFIAKLNSYKSIRKAGMALGSNTVKGIISGLKGQQGALESQLNNIAKTMTNTIKKTLKIHSPSQVMRDEVGANVGAGLVVGMDQKSPDIIAAAKRMAQSAVPDGLMDRISSFVSSAANMMPAINIPSMAMAGGPSAYPVSPAATQDNRPVQLTLVTEMDGREVARHTQEPIDILHQNRVNIRRFMRGRNN